jgi:hypothetical protein
MPLYECQIIVKRIEITKRFVESDIDSAMTRTKGFLDESIDANTLIATYEVKQE